MTGNGGYVKTVKTNKEARQDRQAEKQKHSGKTWKRTDKRSQWGE